MPQATPGLSVKPLVGEKERSKFLSGLLGGITSPAALGGSSGLAGPGPPAPVRLPKPPNMKPLPPLPHVPTIAEFQRTISGSRLKPLSAPLEIPRLEVLPLLGVGPPQTQASSCLSRHGSQQLLAVLFGVLHTGSSCH